MCWSYCGIFDSREGCKSGTDASLELCTIPASTGYGCPRHPYPLVRGESPNTLIKKIKEIRVKNNGTIVVCMIDCIVYRKSNYIY